MKHVQSYAAAFLALALIGCGGSSDNRSSGGDPLAGLSTPRIEAIVRVERASLMHPDQFSDEQLLDPTNQAVFNDLIPSAKTVFGFQDPLNFQTGENFVFQLAAYRSDGSRVVLPATFTSSDTAGTFGVIASNTGTFNASNQATNVSQTVRAQYNGVEYQTQYAVKERQARIVGSVKLDGGNAPANVILQFYNVDGLVVGTVNTATNGTYRASVPQGAVSFTVVGNSVPDSVYRVFTYEGLVFEDSNPGCKAPLPALSIGTQQLSDITLTTRVPGDAGPTPTGCGG
ncbi:hypothetical protein [Fimbriimonas ginsengisoli]|uniref:Lipoprotein n=1 Tax=Fimbriimonas ginsengisoli Gsoil 348 TaxID=661478 RepID=A0A068NSX8_FIMGI|nr:hypothetical protein [Fimbriimonas ginsengisoli]AIE86457.1 hypothetical protein OP10G_3089 [Fimbriimonas ginsengisoli Gsoil 348]